MPKSKTPLDNFFIGFKAISIFVGYFIGGAFIGSGIFMGNIFPVILGSLIIFLAYEISRAIKIELAIQDKAAQKEDNEDDDGPTPPICPA